TDFMDTAAVMMNLDLVITADSSPAHLAGALGVPVWIAVPHAGCWRWLINRDDSPWYPTARLYRQSRPGDWNGVFARLAIAVAERLLPQSTPVRTAAIKQSPSAPKNSNAHYQALARAWQHQQAGEAAQAEALCRQILDDDPDYAEAWI